MQNEGREQHHLLIEKQIDEATLTVETSTDHR
jgi:hypothetical protein